MRDKRCGNCENFAAVEGQCRAHPPVTVIIQPSQWGIALVVLIAAGVAILVEGF